MIDGEMLMRDSDEVYGVVDPAALSVVSADASTSHCVQFRQTGRIDRMNERHSQPAAKCAVVGDESSSLRASAPLQMGRALPQLPADMYSVIDKSRKTNVPFADEGGIPMYESIDPENDSVIDPLYSKLGDVTSVRHERKYDYPIFSGRKLSAVPLTHDDVVYQSASQIYTIGGSEDPYSSITSEPRRNGIGADRDEDSSGIYDPGYAKLKPELSKSVRYKECIQRTEREADQLYSKNGDGESMSSREPSYRYITVRENADVVRERLRQQGQLTPPAREHYYSVIGNEYETVSDAPNPAYSTVRLPSNHGISSLNVSTATHQVEFVPPPPTSPIPDRTPNSADTEIAPSSSSSHSGEVKNPVYSVLSRPRVTSSATCTSSHGLSPETTGSLSGGMKTHACLSTAAHGWNIASMKTATSFAGLDLTYTPSTSHNSGNNRSIMGTKDKAISEFMQRPLLPYGETIYSRRVTEERERIVENNRTRYNKISFSPGLARSLSLEPTLSTGVSGDSHNLSLLPVYNVEITHIDQCRENGGPSAYDIISEYLDAVHSNPSSCRGRYTLPIRTVNERLQREASLQIHAPSRKSRDQATTRPWKDETEEEKRLRLGTIYTAKDYISTIDLGTERPWPMSCSQSHGMTAQDSVRAFSDEQLENNLAKTVCDEISPVTFIWNLSESDEDGSLYGDSETVCYCHSHSTRSNVVEHNKAVMEYIHWGRIPDECS
ncbi:unnamed protein product [Angiostrongylus costaricensis]|uniref:SH2 domain-containing protein n=1 Tax=Angiostrongylus costaricensis TaxID=334426 RepID=A0A158PGN5_ANGCS|nr:unnamed protein product [Angiostrongylus costaricensis]